MIEVVDVAAQAESSSTTSQTTMLEEIRAGLKKIPKQISAKYFYDERGSELFNLITRHPDYYLTQAEMEILQTCKNELTSFLQVPTFNLIELGPGEGIKTKVLIEQFKSEKIPFHYVPIDISKKYLNAIAEKFEPIISSILPIQTDYFHGLSWVRSHSHRRNFVLFLGSSIGNFSIIETKQFLANLYDHLNVGDLVLLGFDLRKDIDILMRAYNDSDGITRAFNFNLLTRLNRELQANFDLAQFKHYPAYNFYTQAMESFLVSIVSQRVTLGACNDSIDFDEFEPIHVESSHKYSIAQIEQLAQDAGFEIAQHFFDARRYFVDSLWRVKK